MADARARATVDDAHLGGLATGDNVEIGQLRECGLSALRAVNCYGQNESVLDGRLGAIDLGRDSLGGGSASGQQQNNGRR